MRTANSNEILERVDFIRKKKHILLVDIARAIGENDQCFKNWRRRDTIPRADVLWNMAELLEVTPEWLLFGEEEYSDDIKEVVRKLQSIDSKPRQAIINLIKDWK